MGKKQTTAATTNQQALRIGTRIRHTEDNVEGRITWANGTAVKIEWADGVMVTWKRTDLASKPIAILDAADDEGQPETLAEPTDAGQTETPPAIVTPADRADAPQADTTTPAASGTAEPQLASPVPEQLAEQTAPESSGPPAQDAAKPKRQRKAPATPKEKKVSCLDAAARVLGEAGQAMTTQEMIDAMAKKNYWTSPGGQTPSATLYSAILRELAKKGTESRFVKTERGKFGPKA